MSKLAADILLCFVMGSLLAYMLIIYFFGRKYMKQAEARRAEKKARKKEKKRLKKLALANANPQQQPQPQS